MDISFKLNAFEGPLDLLLHLIEKNQVDIYDIPIAMITDQYLEYLSEMEKNDAYNTSDFLVMAATLLDIKARMLLPKEVDAEGHEEDPRAELVEKLIEYKTYKYMSLELKDKAITASHAMYKGSTIPEEVAKYEPPIDLDVFIGDLTIAKLKAVFDDVLKRSNEKVCFGNTFFFNDLSAVMFKNGSIVAFFDASFFFQFFTEASPYTETDKNKACNARNKEDYAEKLRNSDCIKNLETVGTESFNESSAEAVPAHVEEETFAMFYFKLSDYENCDKKTDDIPERFVKECGMSGTDDIVGKSYCVCFGIEIITLNSHTPGKIGV